MGLKSRRRLNCPRCWVEAVPRKVRVFGPDVEVDDCPKCGGLWLDGGELGKLLGDRKLSDYLSKDIGTKSESPLVCPRCGSLMDIEKAETVEVDVCLRCRGVWLDAGELDRLKRMAKEGYTLDEAAKESERLEEWWASARGRGRNPLLRLLSRLR